MKFLDPCNDIAFKKLFGSQERKNLTISFLNSILEYKGDSLITNVEFLNTEQNSLLRDEKKENFLDILCTDQAGNSYIIEMQVNRIKELSKRMIYYASKTYAMQLGSGRRYITLKPVITVAILDHIMFPDIIGFKSIHKILDVKTHACVMPELVFAFVELEKFKKTERELVTDEDKWLYFLKWINEQSEIPKPLQEAEFEQACHTVQQMTWSEYDLMIYNKQMMNETDREGALELAEEKGIEKGKKEEKCAIAKELLTHGINVSTIIATTGLSQEEIDALIRKN
jgi:predicted transposase/invertase (TIGR01784 family)